MPAHTQKATGKPLLALLVTILTATLFMASLESNTDGDINAYCDVIAKKLDLCIQEKNLQIDSEMHDKHRTANTSLATADFVSR